MSYLKVNVGGAKKLNLLENKGLFCYSTSSSLGLEGFFVSKFGGVRL